MQFYNVHTFPYVSIVDPRTGTIFRCRTLVLLFLFHLQGEKMISWQQIDIMTFCDSLTRFLHTHPTPTVDDSVPKNALPEEKVSSVFEHRWRLKFFI